MSPPLRWRDVGHIGDAERGVAFHRAVDHVDGIATQQEIHETASRALPALHLVLAHVVDEVALLGFIKLSKAAAAVERLARAIDRAQRGAVEIRVGWFDVEDARLEQRVFGRARDLLIDKIGDPRLLGAGNQCLTQCIERCGLLGGQCSEWTPCARASRGVSMTSTPPIVKASVPRAAPFMKARRSMLDMIPPYQGAPQTLLAKVLELCCSSRKITRHSGTAQWLSQLQWDQFAPLIVAPPPTAISA
jgi:hypothetical protein